MLDCLVIGGGHSGLMCAHLLAKAGLNYEVLDSHGQTGEVWRKRPRNLKLFTSRQFCSLADLQMPGDPNGFPSGLEFADHIGRFAQQKNIRVRLNARVVRLARMEQGFAAHLENGEVLFARTVINATGSNQAPSTPAFSQALVPSVHQISARDFLDARQWSPGSRITVVGDGASGRQIALELSTANHQVTLAKGRFRKLLPNVILGRDLFWWLKYTGLLFAGRNSIVAKIMRKRDPIPTALCNDQALGTQGVCLKPRAVNAKGTTLVFEDGTHQEVDVVVWCTGYREDASWLDLPLIKGPEDLHGQGGKTPEPGFYVMGRKWLTCRASELILGSERDANRVVGFVQEHADRSKPLTLYPLQGF